MADSEWLRAPCVATVEHCACKLDFDHDGAHECSCGGAWDYDAHGTFIVVRLPGMYGERYGNDVISALINAPELRGTCYPTD